MNPTIAVMEIDYVGLPTLELLASRGMCVQGVDNDATVRATLATGRSHITEPDVKTQVERALPAGFITLHEVVPPADVFIIAVPTPLGPDHARGGCGQTRFRHRTALGAVCGFRSASGSPSRRKWMICAKARRGPLRRSWRAAIRAW